MMGGFTIFLKALVWLAALSLAFAPGQSLSAKNAPDPVLLKSGERAEQLEGNAWFYVNAPGEEWTVPQALEAFAQGKFVSAHIPHRETNVEARDQWIILPIKAASDNAEPIRRSVGLGALFYVTPHIYLVRQTGPIEQILSGDDRANGELFSQKLTYLNSASFDLAAGEEAFVVANLDRADHPSIGLFREGELGRNQIIATMLRAIVTISNLAIGLCLLMLGILARRRVTVLVALGVTFITSAGDVGLYASLFGSDFASRTSGWSGAISILLTLVAYTCLLGFKDRLIDPLLSPLKVLAYLTPAAVGLGLFWATSDVAFGITQILLFAVFIMMVATRLEVSLRLRIVGSVFLSLGIGIAVLVDSGLFGTAIPDLGRLFMRDVARMLVAGSLLIIVIFDMRRSLDERDRMTAERISALEAQAQTNQRLLETEREYARAREMASRRKQQLASASHDIRQPLVGLRASIREEADNLSPDLQERLGEAIDYLEELTHEYSNQDNRVMPLKEEEREFYSLDLIVETVEEMFAAEAAASGIILVTQRAPCETRIPALALTRSVSNLIANALRHAEASKVHLAVRHEGGCLIEVRDNGRGMDEESLQRAQERGAKDQSSEGDGLGLAIIHDLARRHGFGFALESCVGEGTVATITLPKS